MYIVIFCSYLALLLTYLESKNSLKGGMKVGFMLVTFLGMIHYDYGNDYMPYYEMYQSIVLIPFDWHSLISGYTYKEPGWALINYIFQPIGGFFMMVAVLNVIQNVMYYKFIKNNISKAWWPIAVFIYLFSTSYYLLNFSMMRQGFVIALFLGMWAYIKEKKWWVAILGLGLGSMIHTSSLILIPFAFWGFLKMNNGKLWGLLYIVLFISLWVADDFLNNIFQAFITFEEFQEYGGYLNDAETDEYGLGFLINMIPFGVSLYYLMTDKSHNTRNRQLVALATIGFMILPFSQILPLIGRVGMYFNVFSIGAFAISYSAIRPTIIRNSLVGLFVLIKTYEYFNFFSSEVFSQYYSKFHTIFSLI